MREKEPLQVPCPAARAGAFSGSLSRQTTAGEGAFAGSLSRGWSGSLCRFPLPPRRCLVVVVVVRSSVTLSGARDHDSNKFADDQLGRGYPQFTHRRGSRLIPPRYSDLSGANVRTVTYVSQRCPQELQAPVPSVEARAPILLLR